LRTNPQVKAGLAGVNSLLATYHSLSVPAPFSVGASQVTGTSTAPSLTGGTNDTIVDLTGTFDTSGQRRNQAAGANASYKAGRYQFLETLLSLEQQIRDAYWTLAAADAQSKIASLSLQEAQRIYELTVAQQKAGTSPRSDVIRSSIDVANAKQTLLTSQNASRSARIAFNTVLGRPPQESVELAARLGEESSPEATFALPTLPDLMAEAAKNRPLLKSASEEANAAKYSVRQAEASRLPDFNVLYQRSLVQNLDAVTLSLSIPLFDFGGISQSVRAAKEQRKQAEAHVVQNRQLVMQQVAQAYSDVQTAVESASSYKKEILTPSSELLEMARIGYQQGATGILPVIDAEATIRNARVGYINTLLAVFKSQDELIGAVGRVSEATTKSIK